MTVNHTFAEKIMAKYTQPRRYRGREAGLVFFLPRKRQEKEVKRSGAVYVSVSIENSIRQFLSVNKMNRNYREYAVFRNIATVFENRGSRPDLAKKAERELLRILSAEFYSFNRSRQQKEIAQSIEYHMKMRQTHTELTFRREQPAGAGRHEEVGANRHEEGGTGGESRTAVDKQTVLTEVRKEVVTAARIPETDIKRITGEVMRQMEREMHLERLRRGL